MIGFGAVLYAASLAEVRGWTNPEVVRWFAIGGAGLAAFAVVELFVAKDPLLDLRLFSNRTFMVACFVGWVTVVALFGAEFLLPVYLQAVRGRTALHAGLILLPMAAAAGIATPTAGRLYDRIGPRALLVGGFSLLVINTWQFSQLDGATPIAWIILLLILRGTALGMSVQTTMVTALSVVTGPALPRGASLVNATRNVVQSIGVALLATVLAAGLSPTTRRVQLAAQSSGLGGVCESVEPAGGGATRPASPPPFPADVLSRACDESIAGFSNAYRLTFYAALLSLTLGALLPGWPGEWGGRKSAAHHERDADAMQPVA